MWTDRLSKKDAEAGPRVVREKVTPRNGGEPRWCDVWEYEGTKYPTLRVSASVGFPPEDVEVLPVTYDEMRPGCYDPRARLDDMTANHTEASLCFPNLFVRFCGQLFYEATDRDLAMRCVRAYNDWLFDEWCGNSGGRLFGAMILPLWDPQASAEEVLRNAGRPGCSAVTFSEIPPWLGLPSIHSGHWDPLFAACQETDLLVCLHIGSASKLMVTSSDAPSAIPVANNYVMSSLSLSDWLLSGVFDRFGKLRLLYAESQAGWIPYVLERLDNMWMQGNAFNQARTVEKLPSSYFAPHVFCSIFDDPVAIRELEAIGRHNLCFEIDYPHPDSTWPNSVNVAREHFGQLPPDLIYDLVRGNALRLLRDDRDAGRPGETHN